ncbi:MAG: hypothetical protein HY347_04045 [candidate division NC10 bacterium]|nr:hypothetical protein [candidate division NC10 bacterium]
MQTVAASQARDINTAAKGLQGFLLQRVGVSTLAASLYLAAQVLTGFTKTSTTSSIGSTEASATVVQHSASLEGLGKILKDLGEAGILLGTSEGISRPSKPFFPAGHRVRELEWRRMHQQELKQYAGQWVALEGEAIIASGSDLPKVVAEARAKGIMVPYVFYVEAQEKGQITFGL